MAKGLNKVQLIGNLGRDPEVKYTQSGFAVCNFTIAASEEWKDRNSGEKKERAEWVRCVAFGKLAEICGQYLSKGKQVYVEGKLQNRSWEQDGVTKYVTEVVVNDMLMLGGGKGRSQGQDSQFGNRDQDGAVDDQIPF
jgi:single-strand DNA-binding protein